jgi:hypothetical protein
MLPSVNPASCNVCSSLATGAASHKSLKDEHPLLKFYYTAPYALFTICLFNESALVFDFVRASIAADSSGSLYVDCRARCGYPRQPCCSCTRMQS